MGQLPSPVLVFLIIGGIIAFIGSIIALFWALATIEGVASVIMLLAAWGTIRALSGPINVKSAQPGKSANVLVALGIAFFALMGVAVDQTGNYFYNKPLEWLFCPAAATLHRGVNVTNPLPGRTDVTQDFACVSKGQEVESIGIVEVIGARFGEYVLLGYALIGISRLYNRLRRRRSTSEVVGSPETGD